jgi:hypothetical protein
VIDSGSPLRHFTLSPQGTFADIAPRACDKWGLRLVDVEFSLSDIGTDVTTVCHIELKLSEIDANPFVFVMVERVNSAIRFRRIR